MNLPSVSFMSSGLWCNTDPRRGSDLGVHFLLLRSDRRNLQMRWQVWEWERKRAETKRQKTRCCPHHEVPDRWRSSAGLQLSGEVGKARPQNLGGWPTWHGSLDPGTLEGSSLVAHLTIWSPFPLAPSLHGLFPYCPSGVPKPNSAPQTPPGSAWPWCQSALLVLTKEPCPLGLQETRSSKHREGRGVRESWLAQQNLPLSPLLCCTWHGHIRMEGSEEGEQAVPTFQCLSSVMTVRSTHWDPSCFLPPAENPNANPHHQHHHHCSHLVSAHYMLCNILSTCKFKLS